MQVLLTGASSFLGRHATRHLVGCGHSVIGTYRTRNDAIASLEEDYGQDILKLQKVDVSNQSDFWSLPQKIDAVVHIAGVSTSDGVSIDDMLACNVTGARNIQDYALQAGAEKLIYASTLSVHGTISDPSVTENTPHSKPDVYGASKLLAERIFEETAKKLPVASIRLPGILGRGAHRAWLPDIADKILGGDKVEIYNPNAPCNNAAHVTDLSMLFDKMLRTQWVEAHAFPVAAAGMLTIRDVVERLAAGLGAAADIKVVPSQQPSFTVGSDYAIDRFDYSPTDIGKMLDKFAVECRQGPQ